MKNKHILFFLITLTISINIFAKEEKISLQLQWLDQFQFAGYYMAKEKGFYHDVNLDVTIKKFDSGINVVDEVTSNKSQYGIGRSSLIIEKSKGKNVIALAAIFQSSPLALISLKSSNINNIEDLKNKKIMITNAQKKSSSLSAMLTSRGVTFNNTITKDHDFSINELINKKSDLVSVYLSNEPFILNKQNIKYKVFSPLDFGFNFYNDLLFTSSHELHNHPKRVDNFLKASLKGWEYAFKNIDESIDIILKKYNTQKKTREALVYEANILKELAYKETHKLGHISKKRIQRLYDIYIVMGLAKSNVNFDDFIYSISNTLLNKKEKTFVKTFKNIKVHNEMNWPPYNFNEKNVPKGFSIDYMNLIAKKTGLSIKYTSNKTWEEYLFMIKQKHIDIMLNIVDTPKRREYLNFTSSYSKILPSIFTLKKNNNIRSLSDLNGKVVAIPKGFYTTSILKKLFPNVIVKETSNILESLQEVAFKKADATISDFAVANFLLEKNGINNITAITNIPNKDFQKSLNLATRKDLPILQSILQKGMNSITDEELLKLRRKWFGNRVNSISKDISLTQVENDFIQKLKVIKMCVDPNWAPFESIKNGEHIGMIADYIKFFSHLLNVNFSLVKTNSWQESLSFIKSKKCDILPAAALTFPRLKYLNFTKPYLSSPFVIATTMDKAFIENFRQIKSKTIGMVKGYSSIDIFKSNYPNIKIKEYDTITKGLQAINEHQIYGLVDVAATIGFSINKNKYHDLKISGRLDENLELSVAVRSDYPILLSVFQKAIDLLSKKGRDDIYNKWIAVKFDQGINYNLFLKIAMPIISILIIIIFYLWNIKLKEEIKNKRRLEKKLKASISDFKMLVNSTLEAIFIFDKNGYCIEANNEAIKLFNFANPSEILGEHILCLIDDNSKDNTIHNLKERKVEPYEVNLVKYDKTIFPGLIKSIHSTRGHKNIRIISIIDLSDLKEKEKLLFQQSKMALMGEMMSAIAHQWRQPLNAIAALNMKVDTLLEFNDLVTSEQYSAVSKGISTQLNYMSKTIDDFRDFFIPNKRRVNFSIAKAIEDVYDMLSPQFKTYDIDVKIETQKIIVCGYQNEFKQVLINIINNSKDAIISKKRKKRYIHIKVEAHAQKKALITISDNGGGIDDDIITKIFDPYFTTKFKSQGTGIGLYMSKMIIEKSMSGNLSVINSKDGVIFNILI